MGWLVVNVVLPVFLPLMALTMAMLAPAGRHLRLMEMLKDGQLCWVTLTFSCSSFYDLLQNDQSAKRQPWEGIAMPVVAAFGALVAVYAVVATIQKTPLLAPKPDGGRYSYGAWAGHYIVFIVSAALTTLAGAVTFWIHLKIARAA